MPLEAHTGVKPDLSYLQVLGSRILSKVAGQRRSKLDHRTYMGIFIGYRSTDKNINYIDDITSQEKLATHVVFNKAHYTSTTCPQDAQFL